MRKCRNMLLAAGAIAIATFLTSPAPAQSPGSKAVADKVAKEYGVTVLHTEEGEIDGKAVVFVTVMKDGGNSNDAFQVTTLAVDPATGDLVSQFRTTPTGQRDTAPGRLSPSTDESGQIIRQWSSRPDRR